MAIDKNKDRYLKKKIKQHFSRNIIGSLALLMCFSIILCNSILSLASDNSDVYWTGSNTAGIRIAMPGDWLTVSREEYDDEMIGQFNSMVDGLGTVVSDTLASDEYTQIYAADFLGDQDICVRYNNEVYKNAKIDYNSLTNVELRKKGEELVEGMDVSDVALSIERTESASFVVLKYTIGSELGVIRFFTVKDDAVIEIVYQNLTGELTSDNYSLVKKVAYSMEYLDGTKYDDSVNKKAPRQEVKEIEQSTESIEATDDDIISTPFESHWYNILASYLLTAIIYLVPALIIRFAIHKGSFTRGKAILIALAIGIVGAVLFSLIHYLLADGQTVNGAAMGIWVVINSLILGLGEPPYKAVIQSDTENKEILPKSEQVQEKHADNKESFAHEDEQETNKEDAINFCKYCGAPVDEDSVFCHKCGKRIAHRSDRNT